ncbi:hypothetical protein F4804DRAFT_170993 [Jackrogersella minutella]|nr:hypothetical protein F4804DRAFT_170993 [Jackrogersella minutella]
MSVVSRRSCGTGGAPGYSPSLVQGTMVASVENIIQEITHDEKNKDCLACPFWKHNPTRYLLVKNSCTEGVGFRDIGKLMEHIRRVHCLWNGCENCGKRFNQCRIEAAREEKRKHMANCSKPVKALTDSDSEWMTEAQNEAYGRLNFQKDKGDSGQCYNKICSALWGADYENEIPEPYHQPGFQLSILKLRVWKVEQNLKESHEETRQNTARHDTALAVPAFAPNMDPMFLRQSLHDLSSGPKPFYREQHQKDSGIGSWDHSSENQPIYNEPAFQNSFTVNDGEKAEDEDPIMTTMEYHYGSMGPPFPNDTQVEWDKDHLMTFLDCDR